MPELPEVEIISRGLKEQVCYCTITVLQNITHQKFRIMFPNDLSEELKQSQIIDIKRRAKYIEIILNNDFVIIVHLGMSGKLLVKNEGYNFQKHDHFAIFLNNGKIIVFNDPRRFGLITVIKKSEIDENKLYKNLGVEPLSNHFTIEKFSKLLKTSKPIKPTLMDNAKLVGVGNIYASESLFLSKILTSRPSNSLTNSEIEILRNNIIKVLEDSIKMGGSSLKDYASVSGEKGYFQNNFFVYGRAQEECKICKTKISKINQAGRASFYCANCQI